ncbi:unnamed protein product, partial [Owenia fusiformis]
MAMKKLDSKCEEIYGPTSARGSEQTLELKLKKRTGDSKKISVCNDIYELYIYVRNLVTDFPRCVLGSSSKIPELVTLSSQRQIRPNIVIQPSLLDLSAKVTELSMDLRKMSSENEKIKNDLQSKIKRLECEVTTLKEKVGQLQGRTCTHNLANKANASVQAGVTSNDFENNSIISEPVNPQASNQLVLRPRCQQTIVTNTTQPCRMPNANSRIRKTSEVTKTLIGNCDSHSVPLSTPDITANIPQAVGVDSNANEKQDGDIAQTTSESHDRVVNDALRNVDAQLLNQDKNDHLSSDLPENDWSKVTSKRRKRHLTAPAVNTTVVETTPISYANVVSNSKPKLSTNARNQLINKANSTLKPARSLRGVSAVKHVTLYVENIAKDRCESDNDIILQIKDHA